MHPSLKLANNPPDLHRGTLFGQIYKLLKYGASPGKSKMAVTWQAKTIADYEQNKRHNNWRDHLHTMKDCTMTPRACVLQRRGENAI
jgi:hypothetical protein